MIALSPAYESDEIINGPKGLRARKILNFENYGSLPITANERQILAKKVRNSINEKFPDYVRKQKSSISGLPGFWLNARGKVQIWSDKNYSCPLMLIPYRNAEGLIQACQIRFMSSSSETETRYFWLSTPEKSGGVSSGTPLHFASNATVFSELPVLITEGALKAETTKLIKTDFTVIANGGVSCSHDEIVVASRARPLFIAFDSDYQQNAVVARQIAGLLKRRNRDAKYYQYDSQTSFFCWSKKCKGIDDALLNRIPIDVISPVDWFETLDSSVRQKIKQKL